MTKVPASGRGARPVALLDGHPAPQVVTEAGFLHGLGCFETLELAGGQLQHLDAHVARLARGLETLELAPDGGLDGVLDRIGEAVEAFDGEAGTVRVSVHSAQAPQGLAVPGSEAHVLVQVTGPRYPDLSEGVAAVTSPVPWPHGVATEARFKAPSLTRLVAHRQARQAGAFEGLLLSAAGKLVAGTRSNVWLATGDRLVTPPAPPALPGITRDRVLTAGKARGHEVEVTPVPSELVAQADELLLTFTGPGVVPVVELDGGPIGDGTPGPWARRIARWLAEDRADPGP